MNPNLIGEVQGKYQRETQDPLLSIMPHPLFPGICGATVAGVRLWIIPFVEFTLVTNIKSRGERKFPLGSWVFNVPEMSRNPVSAYHDPTLEEAITYQIVSNFEDISRTQLNLS